MIPDINGHIHTPYSFSAFSEIEQAFSMAKSEKVDVLGINDFYVTDGYNEFNRLAAQYRIFPLFNVEFIALNKEWQAVGIRVNDPGNPGRTYFSGKALAFPEKLSQAGGSRLADIKKGSQEQVKEMISLSNKWFCECGMPFELDYAAIKSAYAKELVRERHIAKAIREAVFLSFSGDDEIIKAFKTIYGDKPATADIHQSAALENEIRNNLLKAGGIAFVPEDDNAFISLEEAIGFIIKAGGIPCYPVLLDDKSGKCTEFESDYEQMYKELTSRNIFSIELIPGRNSIKFLEPFVEYFNNKGFVITMGTEHNAPDMIPVKCDTRERIPLTDFLRNVNYQGACVLAAHQFLVSKNKEGYINSEGIADIENRQNYIALGNAIIRYFITGKQFPY